jgi:ATP-dependent 26S proteasome regulatory subunit
VSLLPVDGAIDVPSASCLSSHGVPAGADIKSLATEAGLLALRERRMRVTKKVSPVP